MTWGGYRSTYSTFPCTLLSTSAPPRKLYLACRRGHPTRHASHPPLRLLNDHDSGEKCLLQCDWLAQEVFDDMHLSYLSFLRGYRSARSRPCPLSHTLRVYEQRDPPFCLLSQLKYALARTQRVPPMWLAIDQAFVRLVLWILQSKFLTGTAIFVDNCRIIAVDLELDFRNAEASWTLRY